MRIVFTLFLFVSSLFSSTLLENFMHKEHAIQLKLLDENSTEKELEAVLNEQSEAYLHLLLYALDQKKELQQSLKSAYRTETLRLLNRIRANKRLGNSLAVSRDTLALQNIQLKRIILKTLARYTKAVELPTIKAFNDEFAKIVVDNQKEFTQLGLKAVELQPYQNSHSSVAKALVDNAMQQKLLIEMNNELLKYATLFQEQLYENAILADYGVVALAFKLNQYPYVKGVNTWLKSIGLSVFKVVALVSVTLFLLLLRYGTIMLYTLVLQRFLFKDHYLQEVMAKSSKTLFWIFLTLYVHVVYMILTNFLLKIVIVDRIFYTLYIVEITYLIYQSVNAVVAIKLRKLRNNNKEEMRKEVINLALRAVNILIWLIGMLVLLKSYGVDLTAILSGLGIGGVAVAFAAKDTIANFFGSVSILMSNIFSQGDWVEIGDEQGTVVEIGLRATTIRTFDNALITIPNFKFADSSVKNWSNRTLGRRIKMHIGVTYESNMEDLKTAVNEIRSMLEEHPQIANDKAQATAYNEYSNHLLSFDDLAGVKKTLMVHLDQYNSSSIDILIYCFSTSVVWADWLAVKEDVMYKIAEILTRNHLSFAYPALAVHLQKETPLQENL